MRLAVKRDSSRLYEINCALQEIEARKKGLGIRFILYADERVVGEVKRIPFSLMPSFLVQVGETRVVISRSFTLRQQTYRIKGEPYSLVGDMMGFRFRLESHDGRTLMKFERKDQNCRAQYLAEVENTIDPLWCAGVIIAVDLCARMIRRFQS